MVYLLQEIQPRSRWQIKIEGHQTFLGLLEKLTDERYRLHRYAVGEVETNAREVPRMIRGFFPEAEQIEVVNMDGSRRPMKSEGNRIHVDGHGWFTYKSTSDLQSQLSERGLSEPHIQMILRVEERVRKEVKSRSAGD